MPTDETRPTYQLHSVSRAILVLANQDFQRSDFLHEVSKLLLRFSGCDEADICLLDAGRFHRSTTTSSPRTEPSHQVSVLSAEPVAQTGPATESSDDLTLDSVCRGLLTGTLEHASPRSTTAGSLWTTASSGPLEITETKRGEKQTRTLALRGAVKSIAWIPFALDEGKMGLLVLKSKREELFTRERVQACEIVAQILGVSLVHRRTQLALRERVKELTCLYGIERLVGRHDVALDEILQSAVELFPPAWLHPDIASARIVLDGRQFLSHGFREGCHQLRADLVIDGRTRGLVEVTYAAATPLLDEGPFLREERHLIDIVAKELALIIDQHEAEAEKERLQEQLRHADRLATIGQLAAGVAHELNEPLGSILGFAQLAQKDPDLSDQISKDLGKIVAASLHAREVVRKLMLLARQAPPTRNRISLNALVDEGLYFLESRCATSGIELVRELQADLPKLTADPGQLHQVLINLAVNAIQAMPEGGCLTIRTTSSESSVSLVVEDTGAGMSDEVRKNVFLPFFTTKDVGKGTGLGLSVVEGIVSAHGGSIAVESKVGAGTTFTVQLPLSGPADVEKASVE